MDPADVDLCARLEERLRRCGRSIRGASDSSFWESPSALWSDEAYRLTWYAHAKRYWEDAVVAPPTLEGVLGGFGRLDGADVAFSKHLLAELGLPPGFAAADLAAGIGRVTARVLIPSGAGSVDVVEQSGPLLNAAPEFVGCDEKCRFMRCAMQQWKPEAGAYDVVWIQWCVGHLTDADFVAFLATCRDALRPGGLVVIKDNVLHDSAAPEADAFYVDDDDRSLCRSLAYFRALFDELRADVRVERRQPTQGDLAFPTDIYPVFAWVLDFPEDDHGAPPRAGNRRPEPDLVETATGPDAEIRGLGNNHLRGW